MKTDLDRLMAQRELAALIIAVDHNYSPPLDYLVGNIKITNGLVMKKQGADPVLFVGPMEIEEAKVCGYPVYTFNDMGWQQMLEAAEGNRTKAEIVFWGKCLEHIGVASGKVGIYGVSDLNIIIELIRLLDVAYPQYQFVGELGTTVFAEAAATKDPHEVQRLQSVAQRTSATLQATWDFISSHAAQDDTVIKADGTPLTIGEVKRFVRRELLDRQLQEHGMIFAQGRDGGFPHSRGQDDMALRVGVPIVFDLFPQEMGGGYFHDVTRTWCIGHAPAEVQEIYDQVMEAFDIAIEAFGLNKPVRLMQEAVQDYFEGKGHPTSRSNPDSMDGYVHGLGHGIGLQVHETPRNISHLDKETTFQAGYVITIEPGLYYPDKGYGVRVEDSIYIAEDGTLITLTDFHKDLVLPLKG